ncbi:leucine-rich repeat-containing protein 56 [Rhinatrema bivittatum]|uniref:leucine-rich repeat-containing protein 56 n=1 Tax=Rhinatrema bivittatum TaxID=194408 RepID=UPI00112A270B|nr:leucine-rich repeat-containing protein 56 [Rhinatrema bivittatum]
MKRNWDPFSCALRPGTATVRVRDFGWQGLLNPKPLSKEEEEDLLVDEYLSPAKLQALTGVDDLQHVKALEMCVDTRENSLGNFGAYLPNLKQLKLNNSLITSIRDLGTTLSHLPVLLMARCGLEDLDGISSLCSLKELYLAYNNISDLSQMSMLDDLEVLDLEGNNIDDITQIQYLRLCSKLSALTLEGNHICLKPHPEASENEEYNYRAEVKKLIPRLKFLDEVPAEQTRIQPSITINEDWLMVKESIKDGCGAELFTGLESCPITGRRQAGCGPRPATSFPVSVSRPHGSPRPGSAGRPSSARLLSSPSTESMGSDEMSPEDEASDLTHGVSRVICGNPIKALRARREKLGTASLNCLKQLSHLSDHMYDSEEMADSHWEDVFAELRVWRGKAPSPEEESDASDGALDTQDPLQGPSGISPSKRLDHHSYQPPTDTWSDTQSEHSSEDFLSEGTPPQAKKQSPPEDLSFASFIQEMSESIPFQLQAEKDERQQTLEILQFVDPPKHNLAIPVHEVLLQLQQRIWEHPCTTPGVNRRVDSTYLVQAAPGFEKPQLPHTSLVVESAQKKSRRSRTHASIPPGKDNRFLDLMGRKIYQGAMLNSKIAAYQLYMTQHQRNLWKQIEEFLPSLPQQQQEAAQQIVQKGLDAGKHEVRAAHLEAVPRHKAPQVLKITHSDEEEESSLSDSSNKEDTGGTCAGFIDQISPHPSSLCLSPSESLLFLQESSSSSVLNSRLPTPPASPSPPSAKDTPARSWKTRDIRLRRLKVFGRPAAAVVQDRQCQVLASREARRHLADEEFAIIDLQSMHNGSDPTIAETDVGSRIHVTQSNLSRRLITGSDSSSSTQTRPAISTNSPEVIVAHQPVIRSSAKTSERLTLLNSVRPLTSKAALQKLPNRPAFLSFPSKTSSSS